MWSKQKTPALLLLFLLTALWGLPQPPMDATEKIIWKCEAIGRQRAYQVAFEIGQPSVEVVIFAAPNFEPQNQQETLQITIQKSDRFEWVGTGQTARQEPLSLRIFTDNTTKLRIIHNQEVSEGSCFRDVESN
ncbi:MAG TPA: hypothetical protein IGS53_29310 [Leptolyngbyaceae cyanobacterium M33_DOE_097]|uniref:C-type lysozyme inhibitor domain-containing protein n=1 Tax=Oscillatoriales cyanobacterium SpSt-418 TaxID=2282169 RepID=A0A7C3PBT3_9CYAN|nr:hypothetical protein [Leptolyngbyaceae cyanobacterium M33_DOE_097]